MEREINGLMVKEKEWVVKNISCFVVFERYALFNYWIIGLVELNFYTRERRRKRFKNGIYDVIIAMEKNTWNN